MKNQMAPRTLRTKRMAAVLFVAVGFLLLLSVPSFVSSSAYEGEVILPSNNNHNHNKKAAVAAALNAKLGLPPPPTLLSQKKKQQTDEERQQVEEAAHEAVKEDGADVQKAQQQAENDPVQAMVEVNAEQQQQQPSNNIKGNVEENVLPPSAVTEDKKGRLVPLQIQAPFTDLVAPASKPLKEGRNHCPGAMERSRTLPSYTQCTHGMSDVVSSFFHRDGYWRDCLTLAHVAHFVRRLTPHRMYDAETGKEIYAAMDVGGNIGACSMLVLSQPGWRMVAFEPVKRNYETFHMSAYLSNFHDRLALVRAAATDSDDKKTADISIERGNHGNSIVFQGNDHHRDSVFIKETIQLVKIDNIVSASEAALSRNGDTVHVHVWKLDCQGMELPALRGAQKLLQGHHVDALFIEFDTGMTRLAGYDIVDLMKLLYDAKYVIFYTTNGVSHRVARADFAALAALCNAAIDVVVLSETFLKAAGEDKVKAMMEVPQEKVKAWLLQEDRERIPGLDF